MRQLDLQFVRECFPAFQHPLPAKTAFFENAGGSYVAGTVLEKYMHFYQANKVQPYGASQICHAAGEQMDAGRQTMADLLGVNKDTVTIGPSTTQNFNTLAIACQAIIGKNDSVIVTQQDHEANIGAWERLCRRQEANLLHWTIDETGELNIDRLEELLDESVKVICMTHSSNIVGTINPVEQVIAKARPRGIRVVVDGVSFAPHQWPNIPVQQPDAYCFSTYKTYATHLGIMYVEPDFAAQLAPQCHYFNLDYPEKRFDAAGPDHASIAALDGLGDYFTASYNYHIGGSEPSLYQQTQAVSQLMHAHETEICANFLEGIEDLPVRIIGRTIMEGREANIAMTSDWLSSATMSQELAKHDIAAGNGNFYAIRLLESAGVKDTKDGVLRISFSHYNSQEDVDRTVDVLTSIHQNKKRG